MLPKMALVLRSQLLRLLIPRKISSPERQLSPWEVLFRQRQVKAVKVWGLQLVLVHRLISA